MNYSFAKHFLLSISLVLSFSIFGQDSLKQISLGLNYARHGSGDMDGILVNFDYNKNYSKRISIVYTLGFSIHGQKAYPGTVYNNPLLPTDLQTEVPRWVTGGLQIGGLFTYNFSKKGHSGFKLGVGPILRYQLNSYPDSYIYYGEANPWFRQPFYVIKDVDNNMFNIGYNIRVTYDFKSTKRSRIGLIAFYQSDTNSDLIVGFGFKYGFNFK